VVIHGIFCEKENSSCYMHRGILLKKKEKYYKIIINILVRNIGFMVRNIGFRKKGRIVYGIR